MAWGRQRLPWLLVNRPRPLEKQEEGGGGGVRSAPSLIQAPEMASGSSQPKPGGSQGLGAHRRQQEEGSRMDAAGSPAGLKSSLLLRLSREKGSF